MKAQGTASHRSKDWGQHHLLCPLFSWGGNLASGLAANDVMLQWTMARPREYHHSSWCGHLHRAALVEQGLAARMRTWNSAQSCFLPKRCNEAQHGCSPAEPLQSPVQTLAAAECHC